MAFTRTLVSSVLQAEALPKMAEADSTAPKVSEVRACPCLPMPAFACLPVPIGLANCCRAVLSHATLAGGVCQKAPAYRVHSFLAVRLLCGCCAVGCVGQVLMCP